MDIWGRMSNIVVTVDPTCEEDVERAKGILGDEAGSRRSDVGDSGVLQERDDGVVRLAP